MNLKYEGGGFNFCPAANGTDDKLDIITVSELTRLKVLCLLPTAFKGWHTRFRGITLDTCTEVTITSDRALPVHTDGEPVFLQSDIHVCLEKRSYVLLRLVNNSVHRGGYFMRLLIAGIITFFILFYFYLIWRDYPTGADPAISSYHVRTPRLPLYRKRNSGKFPVFFPCCDLTRIRN